MRQSKQAVAPTTLDDELLKLLARQGRRMPYPVFVAAVMLVWLAHDPPGFPNLAQSVWLGAVVVVLAVRAQVLGRLPHWTHLSRRRRLSIAVWLSVLNGSTHGAAMLLFCAPTSFQFAIQSLLLVGLCAGSVATTAGYRPVFLGYLVPVMTPLVVLWSVNSGAAGSLAVGVIIAIFAGVLITLADDAFRLFQESFDIRQQHLQLNQQLTTALAQAEAASRAKTRFLASASHDLRQPIHTLSLFSAALALRPLDQISREIAQHIDCALDNLTVQLDALLDISKLDAGVVRSQLSAVEIDPFMARLAADFAPVAAAGKLGLVLDASTGASVFTDDVLLNRVVSNLLDNAIKYTDAGQVSLAVACHGSQVIVSVEDTGRGIEGGEHTRIFEEFYQLENPERNRTKGLGLGLSIVERLVTLLGIRMEMVSRPGLGTSFYLFLAAHHGARSAHEVAPMPEGRITEQHILVVDDEQTVRLGMRSLLEGLGARVSLADGMAQALDVARRDRPDLLLADLRLRGAENGIELVRALTALHPGLPAILISGDTSPERLREAQQAGIALLHKPVPLALLRSAIADATTLR